MSLLDTLKKKALEATQHPLDTAGQAVSFGTNPVSYITRQAIKQVGPNVSQPADAWYATQGLSAAEARAQGRNAGTGALQVAKPIPEQLANRGTNDYYSNTGNSQIPGIDSTQSGITGTGAIIAQAPTPTSKYSVQEMADAINGLGSMVYGGRIASPIGSTQDIAATQDALAKQRAERSGLYGYDSQYHLSPDQLSQLDNSAENVLQDRLAASVGAYANEQASTVSARNSLLGGGVSELNDKQFNAYNGLANTFDSLTKQQRGAVIAYNGLRDLGKLAKSGNYQAQIGMIFNFMKTLDPTSTVRESEQATAQNAAGVPDRIKNYWNDLIGKGRLQDTQIDGFISTAKELAATADKEMSIYASQQAKRANKGGIPVSASDFYESELYDTDSSTNQSGGSSTQPSAIDFYNW